MIGVQLVIVLLTRKHAEKLEEKCSYLLISQYRNHFCFKQKVDKYSLLGSVYLFSTPSISSGF